jgi:hypothetical protein
MKKLMTISTFAVAALVMAPSAQADHLQLSLIPDVQLVDKSDDVTLLRLAIAGQNKNVTGIDFGLIALTDGDFKGIGLDLVHHVKGDVHGAQLAAWNHAGGKASCLQWGYVNTATDLSGIQLGLINHTDNNSLLQIGAVNIGNCSKGGWQVGFINVNTDPNAKLPAMVIINGNF